MVSAGIDGTDAQLTNRLDTALSAAVARALTKAQEVFADGAR